MNRSAVFTPIDFEEWPRRAHFEYYHFKLKSKYTVNIHLDITELVHNYRSKKLRFYPVFLYVLIKAINSNSAFRIAYNEGVLGVWSYMVPSYTIFHQDDETFSDIWSSYHPELKVFYRSVLKDMESYRHVKGVKVKPNQPKNCIPISSVPWISFTSISQDSILDSDFLSPIIRFGKYYTENNRVKIPFSIYVNHAVADGYHSSKLIQNIQDLCDQAACWMK